MYEEENENCEELENEACENFLTKDMTRAKRRRTDRSKAWSKVRICKLAGMHVEPKKLHMYSKNKIHCSCPMCAAKTNTRVYKSKGPIGFQFVASWKDEDGKIKTYAPTRESRQSLTCMRRGKKHYKPSDIRRVDELLQQEQEFYALAVSEI